VDCNLAITNGQIIDPDRGAIYPADIAVTDGRVAGISRERGVFRAGQVYDASGCYVTPALIDCHVHCYEHVSPGSLNPDRIGIGHGVGAVLDAGSFGPRNAAGFRTYVSQPATTEVYGLVNISRWGNSTIPGESEIIGFLNPTEVAQLIERSADWIRGVKVRASVSAVGALGILPVRLAKQAAREAGVPLMVHIGNAPPTLEEVCAVLTEGDVITHCFHGKLGGAIARRGTVLPAIADAVARGVVLDIGHGSASFAWATAERALQLGLLPHSISTDLHRGCVDDTPGKRTAVTLTSTMSKLLHLGMPLLEVVRAATTTPARTFGLEPEFGRIAEGGLANLSVVSVVNRSEEQSDSEGQFRRVGKVVEARAVVLRGRVWEVSP